MLTVDEIEDSFEVHFRQQVEDLPDETLHEILNNMHVLRRYAPPSLAASQARDMVGEILRLRQPAPQAEPVIEEQPAAEPEPFPISGNEAYGDPEIPQAEQPAEGHGLEPELYLAMLPEVEPEAQADDIADAPPYDRDDDDDGGNINDGAASPFAALREHWLGVSLAVLGVAGIAAVLLS